MKTNYLKMFLVLSIVVLFLSCDKDENLEVSSDSQSSYVENNSEKYPLDIIIQSLKESKESKLPWLPIIPYYSISFDFLYLGHVWCAPPVESCLKEMVVYGKNDDQRAILYETFINYYENNNLATFFEKEDWNILFTDLTDFCANELAIGNLKIIMKSPSNDLSTKICLIVEDHISEEEVGKENVIAAAMLTIK